MGTLIRNWWDGPGSNSGADAQRTTKELLRKQAEGTETHFQLESGVKGKWIPTFSGHSIKNI